MAGPVDSSRPDDGVLVAYIDGALDAAERTALEARLAADADLRARVSDLRRGGRNFAAAYDVLLAAAPTERLTAILAGLDRGKRKSAERSWRIPAMAAALLIFAVGAAAGYFAPRIIERLKPVEVAEAPAPPNWRQVVAEYHTLTTSDTLAAIPVDAALLAREVSTLGTRLSLSLSTDTLALPHVYLKRAQAFEFRGRPLVQFAYLSPEAGPIALCIIANGRPDAALAFEEREGSNIVFWTKGGLGYMLIGKASREALEGFAGDIAGRMG